MGEDEPGNAIVARCASSPLVNLGCGVLGMATQRRWKEGTNPYDTEMIFRTSESQGRIWSPPTVLNRCLLRAHALQDVMIRTASGRLVLPVYFGIGQGTWHQEGAPFVGGYLNGNFVSTDAHFFDPHVSVCYVLYNDDEGRTWETNRDGELFVLTEYGGRPGSAAEPSVVEVAPDRLLMIVRTGLGRLFQLESKDNGETWSRLRPTQLAGTQGSWTDSKAAAYRTSAVGVDAAQPRGGAPGLHTHSPIGNYQPQSGEGCGSAFQNVESLHEETHVEPGPIDLVRPEGCYSVLPESVAGTNDPEYVVHLPEGYGRWSYPSVFVAHDHVLILHTVSVHDWLSGEVSTPPSAGKLKVLPISWFYGGDASRRESSLLRKIGGMAPDP